MWTSQLCLRMPDEIFSCFRSTILFSFFAVCVLHASHISDWWSSNALNYYSGCNVFESRPLPLPPVSNRTCHPPYSQSQQIDLYIRHPNKCFRSYIIIQWSLGLRCHRLSIFRFTIRLAQGPIVSISDKFSINDMFIKPHGPQFRPIGTLLGGLSRPHPISDHFYKRLALIWLAFQCLMCVACGNSSQTLACISYIRLTIISINDGFRGTNYYR
jgi:hypothetical protein